MSKYLLRTQLSWLEALLPPATPTYTRPPWQQNRYYEIRAWDARQVRSTCVTRYSFARDVRSTSESFHFDSNALDMNEVQAHIFS